MNHELRKQLIDAQFILSDINLFQASKWCAEAINGLPESDDSILPNFNQIDTTDYAKFILAKSYFNVKEFDRCSYTLNGCKSGNAVFLKLYARLLSIDKRTIEESEGSLNLFPLPIDDNQTKNHDQKIANKDLDKDLNSKLSKMIQEIENYIASDAKPNHFLYYLLGIIFNKKKNYSFAQQNLIMALKIFPFNWSCWQELINSIVDYDEAMELLKKIPRDSVSSDIMFKFFEIVLQQEFHQQSIDINKKIDYLLTIFPNFNFLKIQKFIACYNTLDYYGAEQIFDKILEEDPLRLDDLDTYSNMLYVMEKRSKLSFLAQYSSNIDKFRPETCCIIANYHSMKGEHEKAIMYYKRALILNKNSLSAWTLMGHEFVELKNSHAAIESYRRAIDINPKDFRAWYGLGQAYEVKDMHLYSLYYYQRATNLQPMDKRMWQAIGNCYEHINKLEEAIKSFKKALSIDDSNKTSDNQSSYDPYICYKLARIHEKVGSVNDCYKYMKLCFDQEQDWGITDETSKARLWLARHALELRKYSDAYDLTKDLNHKNAHDIEEARAIAREARNRMNK